MSPRPARLCVVHNCILRQQIEVGLHAKLFSQIPLPCSLIHGSNGMALENLLVSVLDISSLTPLCRLHHVRKDQLCVFVGASCMQPACTRWLTDSRARIVQMGCGALGCSWQVQPSAQQSLAPPERAAPHLKRHSAVTADNVQVAGVNPVLQRCCKSANVVEDI